MYIDLKEKDFTKLEEPAQIIKNGGIVVFPTETVYGIGANALNAEAVKKIYEIKKRPLSKPITLLVNSIDMIERVAKDITPFEYAIIKKFFPGPLTIILQKKDVVPDIVTSGGSTVGIRMPANEIALELINRAGVPLATPSANISDKPSKTNIKDVMSDFPEGVDCFIDGGKSKIGVASTIVQVIDGVPHILRQGTITEEQINKLII
jgi:L-threonylcarbamoyladenylate synthase